MFFPNPISITGPIENGNFFKNFMKELSILVESTGENDDITVCINSHGGDTHIALGIYDLLRACPRKTVGIVVGTAQSSASLILQGCTKRYMTAHSTLMLHRSRINVCGSVENVQASVEVFRRQDEQFYAIYAEKTKKNVILIRGMAHRDLHLTANEAVEAGLADEVLGRDEGCRKPHPGVTENLISRLTIQELDLSVRTHNCLELGANIQTLQQLLEKTPKDLLKIEGFGKKSLREIQHKLAEIGYKLKEYT